MEKIEGNTEVATNVVNNGENYAETSVSAHFSLSEFACNDGTEVPKKYRGNVQELMNNLEVVRNYFGGKPIVVNSGYRTAAYNKKVGGAANSQHLTAKASDITISGYTPKQIGSAIIKLISEGKLKEGGVGIYKTFVHYDIRGIKARW